MFEEKQQMFDAYLASNVQNILHMYFYSIKPFSGYSQNWFYLGTAR